MGRDARKETGSEGKKSGEVYGKESSLHYAVGEFFVCSCCGT